MQRVVDILSSRVGDLRGAELRNARLLAEHAGRGIGLSRWANENGDARISASRIPTLPGTTRREQRTIEYEVLVEWVRPTTGETSSTVFVVKSDQPISGNEAKARAIDAVRKGDIRPDRTTNPQDVFADSRISATVMLIQRGSIGE